MYMQQAYKKRVVKRGEEIILSILICAVHRRLVIRASSNKAANTYQPWRDLHFKGGFQRQANTHTHTCREAYVCSAVYVCRLAPLG